MITKKAGMILALAFSIAAAGISAAAQGPQPLRRVIYSLEPGEAILMPESTLCITMDGEHVTLVLAKGKEGPFFVARDGVKKGPFAKLAEAMKIADEAKCDKYTYENLIFSDGARYPFPLGLLARARNGGTVFKWMALENMKDLVVYQRTI